MDLHGFARRIGDIGAAVSVNADALVRKVALSVNQTVVMATPVDTGRARSNWIVALDTPVANEIPPYDPGKGGSSGQNNAQGAIKQGASVIGTYKGGTGKTINITNNLDYIGELNNGKSAQAPVGFVEEAAQAGIDQISGAQAVLTKT